MFLYKISHVEGYVNVTNGTFFNYVFNYTDHLGNIRASWTWDDKNGVVKIMEENHYYPFGLKHTSYNVQTYVFHLPTDGSPGYNIPVLFEAGERGNPVFYKYKYNGKEWQDELGLNFYDYGARNYDPALGRWMNIDPKAENSRRWTPYNYAYNNPMYFVDPDGMQSLPKNDDIITKVSNKRGDKNYVQRSVQMTMTLTVVNPSGADLSNTMFSKSSGTTTLSSLSGSAQKKFAGQGMMVADGVQVNVNYKVVKSLDAVGKNDHVMMLVNSIPKEPGDKGEPVGKADLGGRVSAVELGTLKNNTFNKVATHELGHNLGLDHTNNGGLMNETTNSSMSTSATERGEMVYDQIGPYEGNGTYKESERASDYKRNIKDQVNSFLRSNNIK